MCKVSIDTYSPSNKLGRELAMGLFSNPQLSSKEPALDFTSLGLGSNILCQSTRGTELPSI